MPKLQVILNSNQITAMNYCLIMKTILCRTNRDDEQRGLEANSAVITASLILFQSHKFELEL